MPQEESTHAEPAAPPAASPVGQKLWVTIDGFFQTFSGPEAGTIAVQHGHAGHAGRDAKTPRLLCRLSDLLAYTLNMDVPYTDTLEV